MATVKFYPNKVKDEYKRYGKAYILKKYGSNVYKRVIEGKTWNGKAWVGGKGAAAAASKYNPAMFNSRESIAGGVQTIEAGNADKDVLQFTKDGFKGWDISEKKTKYTKDEVIAAGKKFGTDYVIAKFGQAAYDKYKSSFKNVGQFIKSQATGFGIKNQRNAGASAFNKPPEGRDGWEGPGILASFVEGGMADLTKQQAGFQRQMNFNLENDSDLAQGSHHPWAQPTSISHLISSSLRQSSNEPVDAWEQWASDKTGVTFSNRNGSAFGIDMQLDENAIPQTGAATSLAQTNPMGAFGTSNVMYDLGEEPMTEEMDVSDGTFGGWQTGSSAYSQGGDGNRYNPYESMTREEWISRYGTTEYMTLSDADQAAWMKKDPAGFKTALKAAEKAKNDAMNVYNKNFPNSTSVLKNSGAVDAYNKALQSSYATYWNKYAGDGPKFKADGSGFEPTPVDPDDATGPGTEGSGYQQSPLPNYDTTGGGAVPDNFTPTSGVYNPWAYGQGGEYNMMGPSAQTMAKASMDAMNLANAYFAPQRAELAYQLGDMETDMRRLAVNLGRQVDDPVLQAKLYKTASQAVRTMDIQQNTMAFQLAEARRKEENANWQFYDQLSQEEHRMRLANQQFYKTLDLQYSQYNLQNWIAQSQANNPMGSAAPQTTTETTTGDGSAPAAPSTGTSEADYAQSGIYAKTRY